MKRLFSLALCCALLLCSLPTALGEQAESAPLDPPLITPSMPWIDEDDVDDMSEQRDASGVIVENGRLSGFVTGPASIWDSEGHESFGDPAICLTVDAPTPQGFTDEQRVIITAPYIIFSKEQLGAAMQSTGQRTWQFNEEAMKRMSYWGSVNSSETLPATMGPDEARENAKQVALDFLREAGVGGARVLSALRPEDEADVFSLNVIPEQREAERARILREWHTSHQDYTWVQLQFTLRGLMALCHTVDEGGASCSSGANLYIGDAGEMRDAIIVYAPQEAEARPYTGELRTWREALELVALWYGCTEENNIYHCTDLRGRETHVTEFVVTGVEPGYLSADGETYVPAWIITEQTRNVETGEFLYTPTLWAIDARVAR